MVKYAVLVIDMLEEFVKGRLRAEEAEKIVPNVKKLVEAARQAGVPIIYAIDQHYPKIDSEFKLWGPHAVKGEAESRIIDELTPKEGDFVVPKRRYDAFMFTDLDMLLRELGVDTLIVTGIHTHICVQNTVLGAFYRGYNVIVPVDCVAAATKEWHERGLEYMKNFAAAKLAESDKIINELLCPT